MADDGTEMRSGAYAAGDWPTAYDELTVADRERSLSGAGLDQLSAVARLLGRRDEAESAAERASTAWLDEGRPDRAARSAFWLGLFLILDGEEARGGGWLSRAGSMLDELDRESPERGLLIIPRALSSLRAGAPTDALQGFEEAAAAARRFGDPDLTAMAILGRGQATLALGRLGDGVTLLDEAMVAALSPGVTPVLAGIVHCAVIEGCMEVCDLARAEEWTRSLTDWCERQPEVAGIGGQCLVRQAEILQIRGRWEDATATALSAHRRFEAAGHPAVGWSWYVRGELARVRGETEAAEAAYREATRYGHDPHPGLALLRLATGEVDKAAAASHRRVGEATGRLTRLRALVAHVEIMLAAGDVSSARSAVEQLLELARDHDAPMLRAVTRSTDGAVRLAEGEPSEADRLLRQALSLWLGLGAPLEAARVRVLIGRACHALGDLDTAELEWELARAVFSDLDAVPCLDALDALVSAATDGAGRKPAGGLTGRELEVLEHVATGATNRQIADALVISEKTVARHLSNIFVKFGVTSRAGATAYAFQHELV